MKTASLATLAAALLAASLAPVFVGCSSSSDDGGGASATGTGGSAASTGSGGATTTGSGGTTTTGSGGGTPSDGCKVPFDAKKFSDANGDGTPEAEVVLDVDGVSRRAAIRFPKGYVATEPHPVVFEFHGDQDKGFTPDPSTFTEGIFGANEYGDRAIVVALRGENLLAPEVRDDFAAFVSWDTLSPPAKNRDIAAVRAFRDFVETNACVAPDRTFAVGFSGGGFFAQTMRCFGEDFAGYANFQSGLDLPAYDFLLDAQNKPLHLDVAACAKTASPQLVIHFEGDKTVVPQQGIDTAAFWGEAHGCSAPSSATPSPLQAACVELAGCGAGEDVVLCTPKGGGHEVWSPDGAGVVVGFFQRFF